MLTLLEVLSNLQLLQVVGVFNGNSKTARPK